MAISKLIARPLLRQAFGKLAQKKVLQDLNPAVEQANWGRIYEYVLSISNESQLSIDNYQLAINN